MKHIASRLSLALLLTGISLAYTSLPAVGAASAAPAEDADCLRQPTATCLLDLALEEARGALEDPEHRYGILNIIIAVQAAIGDLDAAQKTLALLPDDVYGRPYRQKAWLNIAAAQAKAGKVEAARASLNSAAAFVLTAGSQLELATLRRDLGIDNGISDALDQIIAWKEMYLEQLDPSYLALDYAAAELIALYILDGRDLNYEIFMDSLRKNFDVADENMEQLPEMTSAILIEAGSFDKAAQAISFIEDPARKLNALKNGVVFWTGNNFNHFRTAEWVQKRHMSNNPMISANLETLRFGIPPRLYPQIERFKDRESARARAREVLLRQLPSLSDFKGSSFDRDELRFDSLQIYALLGELAAAEAILAQIGKYLRDLAACALAEAFGAVGRLEEAMIRLPAGRLSGRCRSSVLSLAERLAAAKEFASASKLLERIADDIEQMRGDDTYTKIGATDVALSRYATVQFLIGEKARAFASAAEIIDPVLRAELVLQLLRARLAENDVAGALALIEELGASDVVEGVLHWRPLALSLVALHLGNPLISGDVLFAFGSAQLRAEAGASLQPVLDLIQGHRPSRIVIEGHTDSVGEVERNVALSLRRAKAVQDWFTANGVADAGVFRLIGHGEAEPIAPNTLPDGSDNPDGRARNRRVEITVYRW